MMSTWDTDRGGREKGVLTALVLGTALVLAVIVFTVLLPVQERRADVAGAQAQVAEQLAALSAGGGQDLVLEHAAARQEMRRLEARWEELRARLDSFKTPPSFARAADPTAEGRIDFKVALFEARSLLLEKAGAGGVALPEALGVEETIGADEDAETRLWQLAAVVKLVECCIDIALPAVERIDILAPYDHVLSDGSKVYAREFPTRIRLAASFEEIRQLLDGLLEEGSFFTLRGFRAERMSKYRYKPLEVTAVFSGNLFDVQQEQDAPGPKPEPSSTIPPLRTPSTNGLPGEPF